MNILLSILLFIIVLLAFLLFLALVVKKQYTIQRDIIINKPVNEVFEYIKLLRNQEKYNKWVMKDPNIKIDYIGNDGTEGFRCLWEGNKQAGKGEQEIKEIIPNTSIQIELRFEKPFKSIGQTYIYSTAISADKTDVKWVVDGQMNYPMNLFNLFIDNLLGKDISENLNNLKRILEK